MSSTIMSRLSPRITGIPLMARCFHKTSLVQGAGPFDRRWRAEKRLPVNANSFGPLTNMPDYSFKDGRPAPFGVKQMIRINKNREYLETIQKLSKEIDGAVERHARLEKEKILEKQRILDSKLKPKSRALT